MPTNKHVHRFKLTTAYGEQKIFKQRRVNCINKRSTTEKTKNWFRSAKVSPIREQKFDSEGY